MGLKYLLTITILIIFNFHLYYQNPIHPEIMPDREAYLHLVQAGIRRSEMALWLCLMKYGSNFNTTKITFNVQPIRVSYGILQISHNRFCHSGVRGGLCNIVCESLLTYDIRNSIACAKRIIDRHGWQAWPEWLDNCKGPNVSYDLSQVL